MKPFNLEEALAGKPVRLRNGDKAIIIGRILPEHCKIDNRPLMGYVLNINNSIAYQLNWLLSGNYDVSGGNKFDIVSMWDEPPKNTINQIENWFKTAVPEPTDGNKLVQIGCHLEEVCEMLDVFGSFAAGEELNELSNAFKKQCGYYDCVDLNDKRKVELLDALCDQIVMAIGVAYMFGMDIQGALKEVADSNDSKFENGRPVFDEQGKIAKGKHYSKPNLEQFIWAKTKNL